MKKKIFIVEDHPIMRESYELLFDHADDLEVSGTCATAEEALQRVSQENADLVLVDISLPGMSGLDFVQEFRRRGRETPILVISGHDGQHYAQMAVDAGANGFVRKGDAESTLQAIYKLFQREESQAS